MCGIGACERDGVAVCVDGELQENCRPGLPALSDETCDGVDEIAMVNLRGLSRSCGDSGTSMMRIWAHRFRFGIRLGWPTMGNDGSLSWATVVSVFTATMRVRVSMAHLS